MTNIEFVERLKLAAKCKTLYVKGGFGAPAGYEQAGFGDNREKYIKYYSYNAQNDRIKLIRECSDDTFFFDCICLGKGILWGWNADSKNMYGGAKYCSNSVQDFGTETAMDFCVDVSDDFSRDLTVGEWLYKNGHIGYYIGNGQTIEATITPESDGVQIRKLTDTQWKKHGKSIYLDYNAKRTLVCPCCGAKFVEV